MKLTTRDRDSIIASVSRIERFAEGYPKLIHTGHPYWDAFFQWEYDLCLRRAMELDELSTVPDDGQGKLVV